MFVLLCCVCSFVRVVYILCVSITVTINCGSNICNINSTTTSQVATISQLVYMQFYFFYIRIYTCKLVNSIRGPLYFFFTLPKFYLLWGQYEPLFEALIYLFMIIHTVIYGIFFSKNIF